MFHSFFEEIKQNSAGLELARRLNLHDGARLAGLGADLFDFANDIHALDHGSKDNVFAIQPRSPLRTDEELRAVGAGASVGHGEDAGAGVLEGEVLVLELGAVVDGFASSTVSLRKVAALAHELGDYAVELGAGVAEALLAGAQRAEVFDGLRHHVSTELLVG